MSPTEEEDYAMPTNYLHIWPKQEFMMVVLLNHETFNKIGANRLVKDFFNNVTGSLVSINFFPRYLDSHILLSLEMLRMQLCLFMGRE